MPDEVGRARRRRASIRPGEAKPLRTITASCSGSSDAARLLPKGSRTARPPPALSPVDQRQDCCRVYRRSPRPPRAIALTFKRPSMSAETCCVSARRKRSFSKAAAGQGLLERRRSVGRSRSFEFGIDAKFPISNQSPNLYRYRPHTYRQRRITQSSSHTSYILAAGSSGLARSYVLRS